MSFASPLSRYSCVLMGLSALIVAQPALLYAAGLELTGEAKDIHLALSPSPAIGNGSKYKMDLAELNAVYTLRQYKPIWQTQDADDRQDLVKFVNSLTDFIVFHGLEESDYPIDEMKRLIEAKSPTDALKLELMVTNWLVKLAHDLRGDRVQLNQLYVGWSFTSGQNHVMDELAKAIAEDKAHAYLTSLTPPDGDYPRLAETLGVYREIRANGGWLPVPGGPTLKPGMSDPRIVSVKARLAAEGYWADDSDEHYSEAMKDAVIAYQARNGLQADGNLGKKSIAAMNIPVDKRIDQIKANMERLRHMPRAYPPRRAVVNIADASVRVFDQGIEIYEAPVIVGRTDRKTPFIQSALRSVIFNPSWHVPAKIAREDILPKLRKDPHYLEKMGFVIKGSDDGDPHGTSIDWNEISASEFAFRLRQSPGDMNSLGRIKFDFDNDFSVYMHGTPHEELFAKADRHLSSGCIRLQDPETFAVMVLRDNEGDWAVEAVQSEIDKAKTHWMKVATPLPLYVIYQTAFFVSPDGPVQFRSDAYNYDTILMNAIKERQ